ncbi:ninjurin-1 isoform X4 [Condylostylus longicornis]|uniref:ninjurin-1 isoform X4 n=1 Tax=Condylostylus longicornis TaxID=2530218 RepID=UPI00244DF232|nr:ninjurin-1 isoform X4 [Condylostylus longicornis]XP_055389630.1 ninjurin-1 isoform X4 [Condylostylus longicornis]
MAAVLNGINQIAGSQTEMKAIDANRYATKKTIAQGMLDIALLTANASQLKYILQVGERHDFYKLMLGLISTSIILQILTGILLLVQGSIKLQKPEQQKIAEILNHIIVGSILITSFIDVIKNGFGLDPAVQEDYPGQITTLKD